MRYLIIGGTGSLGNAFINCLFKNEQNLDVTVLSREEIKQIELKKKFPFVRTVIGDVRDKDSLDHAIKNASAVFNFAALKHVDICELNQAESYKVNLLGAMNVADLCQKHEVPYHVFSSTDKAVLPINVYGYHKGAAERYVLGKNLLKKYQIYSVFRWGNVLGSRGSVVHAFKQSLQERGEVCITHPEMTRFWIGIDEVAKFMYENYTTGRQLNRAYIPKMKSSSITQLAEATAKVLGIKDYKIKITGIRPGEKIHECLQSEHEENGGCLRSDTCQRFTMDELCEITRATL
jgi:UDP-N-acetylglucosamine 4,6-dehydratase